MAKPGFDKWLSEMQRKGKYKTKVRLEGYIKCMVDNQTHYVNGDYYLNMNHGNEIYSCIDENENGVRAARRDIPKILKEVYYTDHPENGKSRASYNGHFSQKNLAPPFKKLFLLLIPPLLS